MKKQKIWLSLAQMGGNEQKYIQDAFDSNWVVPLGPNVNAFEQRIADYIKEDKQVVALSSGTAAIHLGLLLLNIQPEDEVICQSFTFIASANPIIYIGAKPVFIDSEKETWNMSPKLLEEAIIDRKKKTGKYPRAIVTIHLYGMPSKMDEITAIAQKYNIPILEDAAEALGSEYKKHKCGTFGEFSIISFNGNKIITTSGGGVLICKTEEIATRAKFYATQARENQPYYWHEKVGYNYRLSNICAGIGLGQMEVLEHHLAHRKRNHKIYSHIFSKMDEIRVKQNPNSDFNSNFWLTCITVEPSKTKISVDQIRIYLESLGIESRLLWCPMHLQPIFKDSPFYGDGTSEQLFKNGLCLPSGSSLEIKEIEFVAKSIMDFIFSFKIKA